jgi:hypothetical protein
MEQFKKDLKDRLKKIELASSQTDEFVKVKKTFKMPP